MLLVTHDVEVGQEAILPRVHNQGSLQLLHCEPVSLQAEGTTSGDAGQHCSFSSYFLANTSCQVMPGGSVRAWSGPGSRCLCSTVTGLPPMHWRRDEAELVCARFLMAAALLPCKNGLLSHEGLKALLHRQRASASLSLHLLTSPLPQDSVGAVLGLFS